MAVQLTPKWGLRYYQGTDVPAGMTQQENLAKDVENLGLPLHGTFAAKPAASTVGIGRTYYATDTLQYLMSDGTNWLPVPSKPLRLAHNFLVAGQIAVPVGSLDIIPPMFVSIATGYTAKLILLWDKIFSGTSVTYKIQKNGVDHTTGHSATTTGNVDNLTDLVLADGDQLAPVVTAISGAPVGLSIAMILEYTA